MGNTYRADKLWQHSEHYPIEELPIEILDPILDTWLWYEGTPNEVFRDKTKPDIERHHERIADCDTRFPVIITDYIPSGDGIEILGEYDVLDGLHRLCRLRYVDKATHVSVRKVPRSILDEIKEEKSQISSMIMPPLIKK